MLEEQRGSSHPAAWVSLDVLLDSVAARAHHDDGVLILRSADILDWLVVPAGELAEPLHHGLDFLVDGAISPDWLLSALPDILWADDGTPDHWVLWVQSPSAHALDALFVNELPKGIVVNLFVGVDFVGGPEAIEEVEEWKAGLDGGKVSDSRKILSLLDTVGAEHWHVGAPGSVDITVVVVDGETTESEGTSRNVDNSRAVLASDLVKIWDHEKKTLGGGEGCGESADRGRTVDGSAGTTLGLEHPHVDWVAPNVLLALGDPSIDKLALCCGWGDWVDE